MICENDITDQLFSLKKLTEAEVNNKVEIKFIKNNCCNIKKQQLIKALNEYKNNVQNMIKHEQLKQIIVFNNEINTKIHTIDIILELIEEIYQ